VCIGLLGSRIPGPGSPAAPVDRASEHRRAVAGATRVGMAVGDDGEGVHAAVAHGFPDGLAAVPIGVFFSLMIAGLAGGLPHSLTSGLQQQKSRLR
jgi:hypothetical protein